MTIIDDVIYIGGGVCPHHNNQLYIFIYHLNDNKWTRLPTPLLHHYGVVVNINNKLTVIGGEEPTNSGPTNKVVTLQDDQWTLLYGNMNSARLKPAVLSHQQYTIVAGGKSDHKVVEDTIEVFDGHQWTISKTHLPQPMWGIGATTSNNSLIIQL